ncbi:MAG: response regulator [Candidatus Omnitrophota bacterium]|jgi:CheY-like chemotaxis protein
MKKKVLMIDDEAGILMTMSHRLRVSGFDVKTSQGGADGLEKIRSWKPDLVLLDLMMSEMDGLSVLEKIRACDQTKSLPVVITTVKFHPDDFDAAMARGANDYLIKPYDASLLIEKIHDWAAPGPVPKTRGTGVSPQAFSAERGSCRPS